MKKDGAAGQGTPAERLEANTDAGQTYPHPSCIAKGSIKPSVVSRKFPELHSAFALIESLLLSGQSITEAAAFELFPKPYRKRKCLTYLRYYHQTHKKTCKLVLSAGLWTLEPTGVDE